MSTICNFHAIEEALASGQRLSSIQYSEPAGPRVKAIIQKARGLGISVSVADKRQLQALAAGQEVRGIVATFSGESRREQLDFPGLCTQLKARTDAGEAPLVLALDGVTDPHNLGAIVRSADKLPAVAVLIPRHRSASDGPVVQASSAGAVNYVPLVEVPNLNRALEQLKEQGFWVWGAAMGGEAVHTVDATVPLVLVMGSEGNGLSHQVEKNCDRLVSIPTGGHVDSLNVSNACAILLYEVWRQRAFKFQ